MGGRSTLLVNRLGILMATILVLSTNSVHMEITGSHFGTGNIPLPPEDGGPEWTRIRHTSRVGVEGDRQTASNVSLNQLAENLNRLEGNLASLIQSFLSLQRSVFNLEQLQELLVLLLEDILKQSGSMDHGGVVRNPSNPTSSMSKESVDSDDDKDDVNSAEIDEDGDEIDDDTDHKGKEGDEDDGEKVDEKVNGSGKGAGEARNDDPSADPYFGALKSINTPPTTSLFNHMQGENQISTPNTKRPPSEEDDDDYDDYHQSEEDSDESMESGEGMQRTNIVRSKNTTPDLREPVVPLKPHIQEPLITFAAQLEARLNDMLQRLTPIHNDHSNRMALMRNQDRRAFLINTGESPMAPPPRFEPLEIVAAATNEVPVKEPADLQPVRVKLQRQQMSPIISHGGPRVGPEDFSSQFMENLGSEAEIGAESLNEKSTGMINNMLQFGQSGQIPPSVMQASIPSHSQPETLPSLMDRRRRRAKSQLSGTPSDEKSSIHITQNISPPWNRKLHSSYKSTSPSTQTTRVTTSDDFDALIASLLQDLSQHLQQQYLHLRHNAPVEKDIDRAVLELNSLVWIPSSTTQKAIVATSNKKLELNSNNDIETFTVPTVSTQETKTHEVTTKSFQAFENQIAGSFDMAGAAEDNVRKNDGINLVVPPLQKDHNTSMSKNDTNSHKKSHPVQNNTTEVKNVVKSPQWDWLRKLPKNQKQNVKMDWLINTLSSISQLMTFSDELKSISYRGRQLTEELDMIEAQSQDVAVKESEEEFDSQEEIASTELEDDDTEIPIFENTSESDEEMNLSFNEILTTASINLEQHTNSVLGNINEKHSGIDREDVDEMDRITGIATSDEESSEQFEYNDDNNDSDNESDIKDDELHKSNDKEDEWEDKNEDDGLIYNDSSDMEQPSSDDKAQTDMSQNLGQESKIGINSEQENKQTKNYFSEESSEVTSVDEDENNYNEETREMGSFETVKEYAMKDFGYPDTQMLEPPKQHNDINTPTYLGKHIIDKRHAKQRLRLLQLQHLMKNSKQVNHQNAQSHRIKKRQIPHFWDFLSANNKPQSNIQASNLFDTQPNLNLADQFSSLFNHQQQSTQSLFNSQPDQSVLQNQQQRQHPLPHHQQSGFQNPLLTQSLFNSQPGQSVLQNQQQRQHPLPHHGFAQSSLHKSQFGNSPQETPPLDSQSTNQAPGKSQLLSPNHQQQHLPNIFWPPSSPSRNFPFHPPIGGYPQYHGYNGGFHYPQFGYPGQSGLNYEPGESPAAEAAADMEEILTNLFNRYWENVQNMFNPRGQSTTPEYEYEGPVTTAAPTTAAATTTPPRKTTTIPSTTAATTINTTKSMIITTQPLKAVTTKQTKLPVITTTKTMNNTSLLSVLNDTQGIDSNSTHNTTNLNSTISMGAANQTLNVSSTLLPNRTSVPTFSTSLPPVTPGTVPVVPSNRGSTYLFDLIMEMMTLKPTI